MAEIKNIYEDSARTQEIYPITHEKAVIDNNGTTAETKFQMITDLVNQKQMEMGAVPSDLTPTENSTNWVTSGGLKEEFNYFNNLVTIGNSEKLNLSSYEEKNGFPGISIWTIKLQSQNVIKTHISIPASAGEKYEITCNSVNGSAYFLLSQDDIVTQDNQQPSFVSGFTERVTGAPNSILKVTIPSGCHYLAITKSYVTENDWFPSMIVKLAEGSQFVKDEIISLKTLMDECIIGKEINVSLATSRPFSINTNGLWATGSHTIMPCSPSSIYYAKGNYIIWLTSNETPVLNEEAPVSAYAKWQVLLDGVNLNKIVSPPDANYILMYGIDRLILSDKYIAPKMSSLTDKISYLVNKSAQWAFNNYLRGWTIPTSTASTEVGIRTPVAIAKGLSQLVASGMFDEGLVYNTKYACMVQAHRLSMWMVNCHKAVNVTGSKWGDSWQSGLWAAWAAAPASIYPELYTPTEIGYVKSMLEREANRIINISADSDLYWSTNPSSYDGDSRADDVAWNSECLALAVDMLNGFENYEEYKQKLIEFSIIANSMPSDKNIDKNINGYNLQNLHGFNYLDNGLLYNHNILHPDYMMSWVILSATTLIVNGKEVPVSINHNVKKILHSLIDVNFDAGSTLKGVELKYPGGTIYKEGYPLIYYPMGNDWATKPRAFRAFILGGVRGYSEGLDNETDWSRMASVLADYTIGMKNRFADGSTYASSAECDYRADQYGMEVPESNFLEQLSDALIYLTFAPKLNEDSWYTYTINGHVSGVSSGEIVFSPKTADVVNYTATISNGEFSIKLGGGVYAISINEYTLDVTSINVIGNTTVNIIAS